MTSSKRDLRVELPEEGNVPPPPSSGDSSTSAGRWGKVLQSPQVIMEKTANFTSKLAGGMKKGSSFNTRPSSPTPMARTSVNPTSRAAMDAQYRTSLYLRQVRKRESFFFNDCRCMCSVFWSINSSSENLTTCSIP